MKSDKIKNKAFKTNLWNTPKETKIFALKNCKAANENVLLQKDSLSLQRKGKFMIHNTENAKKEKVY